jgi:uncharacterized membrane protein
VQLAIRTAVATLAHLALSAAIFVVTTRLYDEITRTPNREDRLEPWPTRLATMSVVLVWVLIVLGVALLFRRVFALRRQPLLAAALVTAVLGAAGLLLVLSHLNTCNTEIGFPLESRC